jgi:phosphatidylinositol-3-phosphatase
MKPLRTICSTFSCLVFTHAVSVLMGLSHAPPQSNTPRTPPSLQVNRSSLKTVEKVFLIVMENHNWTGNNSGAASGDPDLKSSPLAPYVNGELLQTSAHAEQYFNPPGNHPSQTNYLWLEAGSNFGVLADTQPGQPQLFTHRHLVRLLQDAGISWRAYAEPDYGNPSYRTCPLDFSILDVNHLGPVYFNDVNEGLSPNSAECIEHIKPYSQLAADLAAHDTARYNIIVPSLCHSGHQAVSPCDPEESTDNTVRSDTWLKQNVPIIQNSDDYKNDGALFITWDEGEDDGNFKDGPIGMFLLSPLAKGAGKTSYSNTIHYDHSSTLKTLQEIFGVYPLLGGAANSRTVDLSDLFR